MYAAASAAESAPGAGSSDVPPTAGPDKSADEDVVDAEVIDETEDTSAAGGDKK